MRVHQSLDPRVESIEIGDSPRTHGLEIRRLADSTPVDIDIFMKNFDLPDVLGCEPTPPRLVRWMAEDNGLACIGSFVGQTDEVCGGLIALS